MDKHIIDQIVETQDKIAPTAELLDPIQVHVTNPTGFRRKQPVMFGTRHATPYTYKQLPMSALNVAFVDVPPNYVGVVDANRGTNEALTIHPTINHALANGYRAYVLVNGVKYYFDVAETKILHKDLFAFEYTAKTPVGVAKLWTYLFHNYPAVHLELGFYCESLDARNKQVNLSFGVEGTATAFIKFYNGNPNQLLNQLVDDCVGKVWRGVMGFYVPQYVTQEDINTFLGEWEWPIFALADWQTWGPWDKALPAYPANVVQNEINARKNINYTVPFAHYGELGMEYSGSTGNQGGWGTWQNLNVVAAKRSELLWFNYLAALQEHCRRSNYFETNANRFVPELHPNCVFWWGQVHYHHGVSQDRLGRTHDGLNTGVSGNWSGYDNQHSPAGGCLPGIAILTGSLAAMEWCETYQEVVKAENTLPSLKPGWSTNGYEGGRAARQMAGIVWSYLATGNEDCIRHAARVCNETMFVNWSGYQGRPTEAHPAFSHPEWPVKPTATKGPAPESGALLLYSSWQVWEDAIFTYCHDALRIAFELVGLNTEAQKLREVVYGTGKSVVMHGFHPTTNTCGVALRWDGDGQPTPNYDDPTMAKFYGAYNTWTIPCLMVILREATARNDQPVIARAQELLAVHNTGHPDVKYFTQYLGAQ